jgi:cytoskeleton protein RodZ
MGNFGEDLRKERVSRGVALEQISAETKISQRHLVALEQERFRLLPGGILSKGIVRGYAGALGLDTKDWTNRFLQACNACGQPVEEDWTAFAANVGKSRVQRYLEHEIRMRWIVAIVLATLVVVGAFLSVRYYGVQAGWWSSLLPFGSTDPAVDSAISAAHSVLSRIAFFIGA